MLYFHLNKTHYIYAILGERTLLGVASDYLTRKIFYSDVFNGSSIIYEVALDKLRLRRLKTDSKSSLFQF